MNDHINNNDELLLKCMRKHLNSLLKARNCLKKEENKSNENDNTICMLMHEDCKTYQKLIKHILICKTKQCKCIDSKKLLYHYNCCEKNENCKICNRIFLDENRIFQHSADEKAEIVQKFQKILETILHVTKCLKNNQTSCNPTCADFIKLLDHTVQCNGNCIDFKQCKIIKQISLHWDFCKQNNNQCVICDKYKNKTKVVPIVEPIAGTSSSSNNNINRKCIKAIYKNINVENGLVNDNSSNNNNSNILPASNCNIQNDMITITISYENLMNCCDTLIYNNSEETVGPTCTDYHDDQDQLNKLSYDTENMTIDDEDCTNTSNAKNIEARNQLQLSSLSNNSNQLITEANYILIQQLPSENSRFGIFSQNMSTVNNIGTTNKQYNTSMLPHNWNQLNAEVNSTSSQVNPEVQQTGMLSNQEEIFVEQLPSEATGNSELVYFYADMSNSFNNETVTQSPTQYNQQHNILQLPEQPSNSNLLTADAKAYSTTTQVINPQFEQSGILSNQEEIFAEQLLFEAVGNSELGYSYADMSNSFNNETVTQLPTQYNQQHNILQLPEQPSNSNLLTAEANSTSTQAINLQVQRNGMLSNQEEKNVDYLPSEAVGNTELDYSYGDMSNLFNNETINQQYNILPLPELRYASKELTADGESASIMLANSEVKQLEVLPNHQKILGQHNNFETHLSSNLFNPEELKQALMPTLEKLIRLDPESLPFRTPVDPITLGIPDYFEIVKKPMDLGTVKNNLITGKYSDPWEYVDDVWLMFENAWLYNRKTSRVYRYCTKLSEVFEQEIDPVMQALGYCCGHKYTFNPQVLCCYGKQLCTIPRDAKYYSYQNSLLKAYGVVSDGYTFCQKCFHDIPGDTVTLGDDPLQSQTQIKKDQFKEMKNDHLELEPFVDCNECGRKQHQICVLYLKNIWPGGFICDNCMKKKGTKRQENKFSAKRLPNTRLGIYIETRVNNFLKKEEAGAGEVHIRVVSSSDKIVEVKPGMRRRFVESNELCGEFPYRAKALFAFEEVDGVDVCFFGMHVQEYGSECPTPNTRRVYIAYLDSVHFFKPRQYRTAAYHEILLGYMDYVKQLGFTMAHIWACPPFKGDDYIFHCHPPEQKIPKSEQLQEWYKKMLDKGVKEITIQDYKDILKQSREDNISSPAHLPYFEGDYWPNFFEQNITKLEKDENKIKQSEIATTNKPDKVKTDRKKNNKMGIEQPLVNVLCEKMFLTMKKYTETFFVIRLHSTESAASLSSIEDPDPLINCDFMDGRNNLLTFTRDKHYEFSSLRRAKFSTINMVYKLNNLRSIDTSMKMLVHTYQCHDANSCPNLSVCLKMKEKIKHTVDCSGKFNRSCNICNKLILLCRTHAQQCKSNICKILYCKEIKATLKRNQNPDQLYAYRRCKKMNSEDSN